MRKLYQILYNVGRLTDAPGGGLFPFQGDTLAWAFPVRGDTLAVEIPFLGDTLAWAGLRGGKALGVTKPAFPPRAPPFRARRCSSLWYEVVYWQMPVCCCIGHVHLCRWCAPDGRRSAQQTCSWWLSYCWRDLLLPVVVFLALTCFCLLLYFWRSPASACRCISGTDLLLPVVVLPALICFRLLSAPINNREQARCAGRFPVRRNKKSAQPDTADTAAYRTKPIN